MSTIEFDAEKAHKLIRRLRTRVVELKAERDAAVKLLEAIRQDEQCAHWHEDIDAARGEK